MGDRPTFYCDAMAVSLSVFGARIGLGGKKDFSTQTITDEDIDLFLAMSPQHLKAMVNLLKENLDAYERIFGEINLRPDAEALKKAKGEVEIELNGQQGDR